MDQPRDSIQDTFERRIVAVSPFELMALDATWSKLSRNATKLVMMRGDRWGLSRAFGMSWDVHGQFMANYIGFIRGVLHVRSAPCLVECATWFYSHLLSRGVDPEFLEHVHRAFATRVVADVPRQPMGLEALFLACCDHHAEILDRARSRATLRVQIDEPVRGFVRALGKAIKRGRAFDSQPAIDREIASMHRLIDVPMWWARVITPVMETVGLLWEHTGMHHSKEAIATGIVQRLLDRAGLHVPSAERHNSCLVAVAVGEQHDIGARLVRDTLCALGYPAAFMPSDSSKHFLPAAVAGLETEPLREDVSAPPRVFLSATTALSLPSLIETVDLVRQYSDAEVVLGGRIVSIDPKVGARVGADVVMTSLVDMVKELTASE